MRITSKIILIIFFGIFFQISTSAFYNDYEGFLIIKNTDYNYTLSIINSTIQNSESFIKARYHTFAKFSENSGFEYIIYIPTKEFDMIYSNLQSSFKSDIKLKLVLKRDNKASESEETNESFSDIVKGDYYYSKEIQSAFSNFTQEQFTYLFFETEDTTLEKGISYIKIIWLYDTPSNQIFENLAYSPKNDFNNSYSYPQYSTEIEYLEKLLSDGKTIKKSIKSKKRKSKDNDKEYRDLFFNIP